MPRAYRTYRSSRHGYGCRTEPLQKLSVRVIPEKMTIGVKLGLDVVLNPVSGWDILVIVWTFSIIVTHSEK